MCTQIRPLWRIFFRAQGRRWPLQSGRQQSADCIPRRRTCDVMSEAPCALEEGM